MPRQPISPDQVDDALRALRSDGWSSCWTGRRDRALLVLSQMAGLTFQAIAELTVADVSIAEGIAVIRTPGGSTTLRSAPDGRICGPCALARWLHALDLTAIYPSPGVVTAVIARAAPLTANSPHLCQGQTEVCASTRSMPALPSIDQWGPVKNAAGSIARAVITRDRLTAVLLPERQPSAGSGMGEKAGLVQSARAGSVQRQIIESQVFARHLNLVRSNYSRFDRDHDPAESAQYADGLEGRARALLEHSAQ